MDSQRIRFSEGLPPATKNIIIINLIMWVACIVFQKAESSVDLVRVLGLNYFQADGFYPFQLVSYMFLHSTFGIYGGLDFGHIFFNMFAVYMFGRMLEGLWGSKQFLIFYFVTGIGAGLIQLLVMYIYVHTLVGGLPVAINETQLLGLYNSLPTTIGASGAVYGILLAFGMIFPNAPLYMMFIPVPIKAKYIVIGMGLIALTMGISNRAGDNVAHFAHLGGMLFGIILILYWKKKGKMYGKYIE